MTSKRKFDESDGNNVEDDDIQSGTDSESEIEDSDDDKPTGELPKQSAGVKAVSKLYSSLVKPKQGDSTARKGHNAIEAAQATSSLYSAKSIQAPPLKKVPTQAPKTVGKGWFDIQPLEMTSELKRDIKVLEMRNYVDPTRFYKSLGKIKNVLHTGTVIEGSSEFRSSRLTKKARKQSLVEEILADRGIQDYSKRTYMQIQQGKTKKRKAGKNRGSKK